MTTSKLYEYFSSIFVFKSLKNLLPNGFSDVFSHNFVSRKFMDLRSNFCTRKACQLSIRYNGPKIWNKLDNKTKSAQNINSFKYHLKKSLMLK